MQECGAAVVKSELRELLIRSIGALSSADELAEQLFRGSSSGGEFGSDSESQKRWLQRVEFHLVRLDSADYTRALIRSIWLAPGFAGTDFGGSRQRDLAQVWTDALRGFLGELAFQKFLEKRFRVSVKLSSRRGSLEEFLPSDIEQIQKPGEGWREPKLRVSIKTTKFSGRWLDLPGAQFEHSDVFVLVKLGISRVHFLSFLKHISFIRDKLIPRARELGELSEAEAQELWNDLPEFAPIPAYIAGFLEKQGLSGPIHQIACSVAGRRKKKIKISAGVGLFSLEAVRSHPEVKKLDSSGSLPIAVDPIIESLTSPHFLANSGALSFEREAWESLISRL